MNAHVPPVMPPNSTLPLDCSSGHCSQPPCNCYLRVKAAFATTTAIMLAAMVGGDGAVIVRADLLHDALLPPQVAFCIHRVLASLTNLKASLLRPVMPPASPNRLFRHPFGLPREIYIVVLARDLLSDAIAASARSAGGIAIAAAAVGGVCGIIRRW